MSKKQPPRAGERTRIATMLANAVFIVGQAFVPKLAGPCGLALKLKALGLRIRDLDQPNGQDAITAVAMGMTTREWLQLVRDNTLILGTRWSWIVMEAGQLLGSPRRMARANRKLKAHMHEKT